MHRSWHFTHAESWESGLTCTVLLCVWLLRLGILLCVFLFIVGLTVWIHLHVDCFPFLTQLRNKLSLVSPWFWFFVDYYWVVLATIGPRTTQESNFPVRAAYYLNCHFGCLVVFDFLPRSCELLVWLCVCSGWSLDYVGVGMQAWYAWKTWCVWEPHR